MQIQLPSPIRDCEGANFSHGKCWSLSQRKHAGRVMLPSLANEFPTLLQSLLCGIFNVCKHQLQSTTGYLLQWWKENRNVWRTAKLWESDKKTHAGTHTVTHIESSIPAICYNHGSDTSPSTHPHFPQIIQNIVVSVNPETGREQSDTCLGWVGNMHKHKIQSSKNVLTGTHQTHTVVSKISVSSEDKPLYSMQQYTSYLDQLSV